MAVGTQPDTVEVPPARETAFRRPGPSCIRELRGGIAAFMSIEVAARLESVGTSVDLLGATL